MNEFSESPEIEERGLGLRRWVGAGIASWLGVALMGCAGPAPLEIVETEPDRLAQTLVEEASEDAERGDVERATHKLDAALAIDPDFIEAHRAVQNIAVSALRRGEILRRYERYLEDAPDQAYRWYLAGRIRSSPEAQGEAFARALELDPGLYWAHIGMGYALSELGRAADSRHHFLVASELRPGAREPLMGLTTLALRTGEYDIFDPALAGLEIGFPDHGDSRRQLVRTDARRGRVRRSIEGALGLLNDLSAEDDVPAVAFDVTLSRGTPADWIRARELLEGRTDPLSRELSGRLAVRLGDWATALEDFDSVEDGDAVLRGESMRDHRLARVAAGRFSDAVKGAYRDYPSLLGIDELDKRRDRATLAAANAESDPNPSTRLELARALSSLGWIREALVLLEESEIQTPTGRASASLREELLAFMQFETALQAYFSEVYGLADDGGETPSMERTIEDLRKLSTRHVGRDILEPVVLRDFSPLGAFLDPRPSSGNGLSRYLDRFNRFLLVGQRTGLPVEGVLFDRVVYGKLSGPWPRGVELIVGEHLRIPSYLHHRGHRIFGAALFDFTFLDIDAARLEARRALSLEKRYRDRGSEPFDDPVERALDDDHRKSLSEPLDVSTRLLLSATREFQSTGQSPLALIELILDGVLEHEKAHLQDARLFWPLEKNVFSALFHFVSLGFSPTKVEAWLEMRAQVRSLAKAKDPKIALSVTTSFLPDDPDETEPHALGYGWMVESLVDMVEESGEKHPSIDPRGNIVQQFHRLSKEEMKALGERLYRELF